MDSDKLTELERRLTQWERDTDAASYPIDCDELRDLITAARRPALPDREAMELILRDTLFVRHGYDNGEPMQDVGGIEGAADAILALFTLSPAQAERDGWVLVPREPTEAMILAGAYGRRNGWRESTKATYQGMLSAAPKEGE